MGGDLIEVELDDGQEPAPEHARRWGRPRAEDAGAPGRARRRLSARAWSRLAVPLAVLLAAGVGLDGAAAVDLSRPRHGTVADLRAPRVVEWRAPGDSVVGVVGDAVLVQAPLGAGVVARDLRDGTTRWTVPGSTCSLVETDPADEPLDLSAGYPEPWFPAGSARLVCRTGDPDRVGPTVLVDADDGSVLARLDDGSMGPPYFTGHGVAVFQGLAGGRPVVAVDSLETGAPLWSRPLPPDWAGSIDLRAGALVLEVPGQTSSAYDLLTGAPCGVPAQAAASAFRTGDGSRVETSWADAGSVLTVTDPDGTLRWRVEGAYGEPVVGDDSLVAAQLDDGSLQLRRTQTGEQLWSSSRRMSVRGLVGGTLLAIDWTAMDQSDGNAQDLAITGLEPSTGTTRWTQAQAGWFFLGSLVTDGARFLAPGEGALDVRDARTGARVARWPLPEPEAAVAGGYVVDGVTVVSGGQPSLGLMPLPGGRLLVTRLGEVLVLGW